MISEELQNLARDAFEHDAVPELLRGDAPYTCTPGKNTYGLEPTDWSRLMRLGVLPWCEADPTGARWAQLVQGIQSLVNGGAEDLWCLTKVYSHLCYVEKDEGHASPALKQFPVKQMGEALLAHREELTRMKQWCGQWNPEGLWGDVTHADGVLAQRFHRGFLP
jgi:hypothetical protein